MTIQPFHTQRRAPERSNRAIAAAVGVSDNTVRAIRAKDPGAEFPHLGKRVGRDGKVYKAKRSAVPTSAAA